MFFLEERIKRLTEELKGYIYPDSEPVVEFMMKPGNFKGGEKKGLDTSSWQKFNVGDRWGGRDKHFWFRTDVVIPERFEGKTIVFGITTGKENNWDAVNPQFLAYVDGRLIQGLDVNHREIVLSENAKAGTIYEIALEAYSGMKEGFAELIGQVSVFDKATEKLYYDLKVPLEVSVLLDREDKRRIDIINYLNEAVNMLDLRRPFSNEYYESVEAAEAYLESEFYGKYCGHNDMTAVCVGHTHIDVAWLWTLAQTREKAARSFSTVLNLMKQYPEYIFMSSQPQLYKFVKEDHPDIYKEIRERVKEGRWEPEGAMWLEADCNITSGESLVRQLLFGKRFFKNEFGLENRILWLPDVFGYSAALPQILKKSGVDYFMTTKISWNEYNKVPYDTFMWKGIDGTEILTHFITTSEKTSDRFYTTYNGEIKPSQVMGSWQRYQQKDLNSEVLISFGFGDGGGGPTREMLENAKRMERGIPGCPKVKIGRVGDFFNKLENTVKGKKRLPKWVGELYLEYHRGTYTSMARNKRFNRKSEFLYQDAELFSMMNQILSGNPYPQDDINHGWNIILLNQFHDILPGSSIKEVYEDSKEQYLKLIEDGNKIVERAIGNIAAHIKIDSEAVVVFNQLGFTRSDIVEFDMPKDCNSIDVCDSTGNPLPFQVTAEGKVLFFAESVPAKGYKTFVLKKKNKPSCFTSKCQSDCLSICKQHASNRFFDIYFDEQFNIISIYDKKSGREVLKAGEKANALQAFEDKPREFDAWNIDIYYQEKMWEINQVSKAEIIEDGPVRATIAVERQFLDSVIKQYIHVYNDIPRIDFSTVIDWKEKQLLLKTAFPVDIHADKATYEIQYGNVERPAYWNTSWDYARFEVCAHKWADLSEDGYGVSLMNDCKYGYDIKDGVMRLTLLKSAVDPNIDADRETHEFTYSLYPHPGDWKKAGTVQMAYSLNCPMYAKVESPHEGKLPDMLSFVNISSDNVVVEVVKKCEDSNDIIVRVYECYNRRTTAKLEFFKQLKSVFECDLMENVVDELNVSGNAFYFEIKPYEIKTFKLQV